jgi:hypothetical protein
MLEFQKNVKKIWLQLKTCKMVKVHSRFSMFHYRNKLIRRWPEAVGLGALQIIPIIRIFIGKVVWIGSCHCKLGLEARHRVVHIIKTKIHKHTYTDLHIIMIISKWWFYLSVVHEQRWRTELAIAMHHHFTSGAMVQWRTRGCSPEGPCCRDAWQCIDGLP